MFAKIKSIHERSSSKDNREYYELIQNKFGCKAKATMEWVQLLTGIKIVDDKWEIGTVVVAENNPNGHSYARNSPCMVVEDERYCVGILDNGGWGHGNHMTEKARLATDDEIRTFILLAAKHEWNIPL